TTTAMARDLATWAKFGPPLGSTWEPTDAERRRFPDMHPLVGQDWTVLRVDPPTADSSPVTKAVDLARIARPIGSPPVRPREHAPAWHGTILPSSDSDTWLAAAFADYERIVAEEKVIKARAGTGGPGTRDQERIALLRFAPISRYLTAVARRGGKDLPLFETRAELRADEWYDIAAGKGV